MAVVDAVKAVTSPSSKVRAKSPMGAPIELQTVEPPVESVSQVHVPPVLNLTTSPFAHVSVDKIPGKTTWLVPSKPV